MSEEHSIHHSVVPQKGDVLLLVDLQNCFLPGGSLGVTGGDRIIPPLNRIAGIFAEMQLPVFLSRDWHPPDHISFRDRGGPWPSHCVRNTQGAAFSSDLKIPPGAIVFSKATDSNREEYSAWQARSETGRLLSESVRDMGIKRIFIGGLTTEYCVLSTVKDARASGYEMYVLKDAVEAVNAMPGDADRALAEMVAAGAKLISEKDIQTK